MTRFEKALLIGAFLIAVMVAAFFWPGLVS